MTSRSFRLEDDPSTATVEACYSKRRRRDTQILHSEVVRLLKEWLMTKPGVAQDELLFPVSGRVPGGTNRKTHKMVRMDLEAAREKWIAEAEIDVQKTSRENSDFLAYCDNDGLFADFHANRHLFITNLKRVNTSPKMAQTLARHSDVRLTLGVYTHVGLHDQRAAIESLPAPPSVGGTRPEDDAISLRATGTDGKDYNTASKQNASGEVPTMVPGGANYGARRCQ